jgi:FkbM family methyltransferase
MAVLKRLTDRVTVRRGGLRWTLLTWDESVSWNIYADGHHQGHERRAVVRWLSASGRLLPRRNLVINAGANIGTTAVPLAQEAQCRVLAVEPVPELYELLLRNVELNGLVAQVTCDQTAIAGLTGRREMAIPAHMAGGSELLVNDRGPTWASSIRTMRRVGVKAEALATILRRRGVNPDEVALVWADIQGTEGDLIETGEPLWRAGVPLFMELWPNGLVHRGTDLPVLAGRHFECFVESRDLIRNPTSPAWRPVSELRTLYDHLPGRDIWANTDILLLPRAIDA